MLLVFGVLYGRSGKCIRCKQEYKKAKADGKKVVVLNKKRFFKKNLGWIK